MKALIITDGTKFIQSIANLIKESLVGFKTQICTAEEFQGTDLLPADVFFIGCEDSSPASFAYLEELLTHINLASRKCGVFSIKPKTNKYLLSLLKDCEAETWEPLLAENGEVKKTEIKTWLDNL